MLLIIGILFQLVVGVITFAISIVIWAISVIWSILILFVRGGIWLLSLPPRYPKLTFKLGISLILAAVGYLLVPPLGLALGLLGVIFSDLAMLKLFAVTPAVAAGKLGMKIGIIRGLFIVAGAVVGWVAIGPPGTVAGAVAGIVISVFVDGILGTVEGRII